MSKLKLLEDKAVDQQNPQEVHVRDLRSQIVVFAVQQHLPESEAFRKFQRENKRVADLLISPTILPKTLDLVQKGVTPTPQLVAPEEFRALNVPQQTALEAGFRTILVPAVSRTNDAVTHALDVGSKVREGQMEEAREAAEKMKPAIVALTAQGLNGPKIAAEIVQEVTQEQAKGMSKRERETYLTNFAEILTSVGLSIAADYLRGMMGTKTGINDAQRNNENRAIHAQHIQRTTDMLRNLLDGIVFRGIDDVNSKKEMREYETRMELLEGFSKRLVLAKADDKSMKTFDELFSKTLGEELGRNKALAEAARKLDGKASIAKLDDRLFSVVAKTYDRSIKTVYGV
jgi:hypothetical protein